MKKHIINLRYISILLLLFFQVGKAYNFSAYDLYDPFAAVRKKSVSTIMSDETVMKEVKQLC